MAHFESFDICIYWDAFLGGSGRLFASQVHIHYGHWVHSLKGLLKHLFWASAGPKRQEDSKLAQIESFEPNTPTGMLFWMVLGDTLLPKSIFIMDIGFIVLNDPKNTFFGPLEASRRLKIGPN